MRIPALRTRSIHAHVLYPAKQHLRPSIRDVVGAEVACVDGVSADIAHSWRGRFVEGLQVRLGVFDNFLNAVGI